MRMLLVVLAVLLSAMPVNAATYYVDSASCDDSNNATSSSTPWCNAPGMRACAGTGGTACVNTTLAANDIVYFDREGTWTLTDANGDFAAGLKVTGGVQYIGDTWERDGGSNGTRAKFTASMGAFDFQFHFGFIAFHGAGGGSALDAQWNWVDSDHATVDTVVKGFELDGAGEIVRAVAFNDGIWEGSGATEDCAGNFGLTQDTKRLQNCYIHDFLGDQSGTGQYMYGIRVMNYCGNNGIVSNVEILDNIIDTVPRVCIAVYPEDTDTNCKVNNITVRGNTVSNCGNNVENYTYTHAIVAKGYTEDVYIEHNYIYGFGTQYGGRDNEGAWVYLNDPEVGNGPSPKNTHVRYNIFKDDNSYVSTRGMFRIDNGEGKAYDGVYIYGNLFYGKGSATNAAVIIPAMSGTMTMYVYNNTFYDTGGIYFDDTIPVASDVRVKNNIFHQTDSLAIEAGGSYIDEHTDNVYYRSSGNVVSYNGSTYTTATVTNWEATAIGSDPLLNNTGSLPTGFTGTYGVDLEPNTTGLSIQNTSPAKDMGVDLGLSYDDSIVNGVTRPQGSGWDAGAYEYAASSPPAGDSSITLGSGGSMTLGSGGTITLQ